MADRFEKRHYSTIIVGAGMQGLAFARTCLRLEPESDILLLDANQTIGGVWSKERIYPEMRTNNMLGTYEFTDFPILNAGLAHLGVARGAHMSGAAMHEYFRLFAEKEKITPHIRFGCKVTKAEETDVDDHGHKRTGWAIDVDADGDKATLTCNYLSIATGTCTVPKPIALPGQEGFGKRCFTFYDMGSTGAQAAADPEVKHVTVVGTSKSAYDAVYVYATAGKHIHWVIRKSGHGARFMAPPYVYLGPFKKRLEMLLLTRPLTWLSPCVYGNEDGYGWIRNWLHGTTVGNWIVRNFYDTITRDKLALTGYNDDPKFKPLIPQTSMFWHATQSGIFNYPSKFLDLVLRDSITLVEEDIAELQPGGTVVFGDGSRVQTDALITATGWEITPSVNLQPEAKHAGWGVPSDAYTMEEKKEWAERHAAAAVELKRRFPMLRQQPMDSPPSTIAPAPWRLFRAIAPPSQAADPAAPRNLVFLSTFCSFQAPLRAELASLWAFAYLRRRLVRDPAALGPEQVWHDTARLGQWAAMRHPFGPGVNMPEVMLDAMPYMDLLMNDMGLKRRRGFLGDVFGGPYSYAEWAPVLDEWREKYGKSLPPPNTLANGKGS